MKILCHLNSPQLTFNTGYWTMAEAYNLLNEFTDLSSEARNKIVADAEYYTSLAASHFLIDKKSISEITFMPTHAMTLKQIEECDYLCVDLSDEQIKPVEKHAILNRLDPQDRNKKLLVLGVKMKEVPRLSPTLTRAIKKALKIRHPN